MTCTNGTTIGSVILADDDPDDQYFFEEALREISSDIRLHTMEDGAELMQTLAFYVPDILFLDLDMPVKNGLECLRAIRISSSTKDLAVVVFSSTTRPVNICTAYDMGADLFFIKPSAFSDLKSALHSLLSLDWRHPSKVREQYCVNGRYTAFR